MAESPHGRDALVRLFPVPRKASLNLRRRRPGPAPAVGRDLDSAEDPREAPTAA